MSGINILVASPAPHTEVGTIGNGGGLPAVDNFRITGVHVCMGGELPPIDQLGRPVRAALRAMPALITSAVVSVPLAVKANGRF